MMLKKRLNISKIIEKIEIYARFCIGICPGCGSEDGGIESQRGGDIDHHTDIIGSSIIPTSEDLIDHQGGSEGQSPCEGGGIGSPGYIQTTIHDTPGNAKHELMDSKGWEPLRIDTRGSRPVKVSGETDGMILLGIKDILDGVIGDNMS